MGAETCEASPFVERCLAQARSIAMVAAMVPEYANLAEDVIVTAVCNGAGAPSCFRPVKSLRDQILSEYEDAYAAFTS